mmetsp:Transcript_39573/g.60481  ORF Transcript_39573/g.60481 Transcript_39573/m.60481 type:complete len:194 (+) Transcript_39573:582-1163(+)
MVGEAHHQAQLAEERKLRDQLARKEKEIRDNQNRKVRGMAAIHRERQLLEEKKELELLIERKRLVQIQESQYAHEKAQEFRNMQQLSQKLENQIKQHHPQTEAAALKKIDYTQTRFHVAANVGSNPAIKEKVEKLVHREELSSVVNKASVKQKIEQLSVMNQSKAYVEQELEKQQRVAAIKAEQQALQEKERR